MGLTEQINANREMQAREQARQAGVGYRTPEQQDQDRRLREAEIAAEQARAEAERLRAPQAAEQARIEMYRNQRNLDLADGRKRGEEVFADGSLGRLDEITMNARRAAVNGFTQDEQNAMRDQNLTALNSQGQADLRQQRILAAAEGVRGNRLAAQLQKTTTEQTAQKAALERDLFLKNIEARRQGLADYESSQKYNIDQKNKELQGRLTTEMGYGALGAADRGAAIQAVVGTQQAAAAANQGSGGKK